MNPKNPTRRPSEPTTPKEVAQSQSCLVAIGHLPRSSCHCIPCEGLRRPRPRRQGSFATPITSPRIQHHQALGMPEHTAGPRPRHQLLPDSSPLCVFHRCFYLHSLSPRCSCHPSLRFRFPRSLGFSRWLLWARPPSLPASCTRTSSHYLSSLLQPALHIPHQNKRTVSGLPPPRTLDLAVPNPPKLTNNP